MKELLIRLFGANYRTTLTGIGAVIMSALAAVAALPYQLGDVSLLIPPEWKAAVFKWSMIAATALKILNSIFTKANNVSGNASDGFTVATKKGEEKALVAGSAESPNVTVIVPKP